MTEPIVAPELVEELRTLLREGEEEALAIFLRLVRPEDLAEWIDLLDEDEQRLVAAALDPEAAAVVLADVAPPTRNLLVEHLGEERLARIAEAMPPDDAADLIGDLEDDEGERILQRISDHGEGVLRELLRYPEDSAGGIMNPHVMALPAGATVANAINALRSLGKQALVAPVYVVDENNRLLGYVRLRELVLTKPNTPLRDIMQPDVIAVPVDLDQEHVADMVEKYDFVAVPVVDADGLLVGVITVDDVIDVIEEEATEDIYKLAGSSSEEGESESVWHVARYRLPWLLICLAGTQLSTTVMGLYSGSVPLYDRVSIFIPAIMAMGGNTSLQSSTVTVRRLALDSLPRSRWGGYVLREVGVALLMGIVCGAAQSGVAVLLQQNPLIGVAVGAAMTVAMSAASLLGASMPLLLDLVGVDPAAASGPLVSTINDSLGLAIYFTIAAAMLVQLG